MNDSAPDCVLITGATTGIGLALAKRLIATGDFRLILTARPESMQRFDREGIVEGDQVWLMPLDVTDPDMRREVVRSASARWGGIDVLINNAGLSYRSVVEHTNPDHHAHQMDVNFRAPMELIRLVLPSMRRKQRGRIINVSSVGGMMAMPTMAPYSASKFALEGASESLWYEVRPFGVHVTLVAPGFINSQAFEHVVWTNVGKRVSDEELLPYNAHYANMSRLVAKLMSSTPSTPESVARRIHKTITRRNPPLRVAGTFDAWLFGLLRRLLPRTLYHLILYWSLPNIGSWGAHGEKPVLGNRRRRWLTTRRRRETPV